MLRKTFFYLFIYLLVWSLDAAAGQKIFIDTKPVAGVSECRIMYRDMNGENTPLFLSPDGRIIKDPTQQYAVFIIPDVAPFSKIKLHEVRIFESSRNILYKAIDDITFLFRFRADKYLVCKLEKLDSRYYLRAVDYNFAFKISNLFTVKGLGPEGMQALQKNLRKNDILKAVRARGDTLICRLKDFYPLGCLYYYLKREKTDLKKLLPPGYSFSAFTGSEILVEKKSVYIVRSNETLNLFGMDLKKGINSVSSGQYRNILFNLLKNPRKNKVLDPYMVALEKGAQVDPKTIALYFSPKTLTIRLSDGGTSQLLREENLHLLNDKFHYDPNSMSWILRGPLTSALGLRDLKKRMLYHELTPSVSNRNKVSFRAIQNRLGTYNVRMNFLIKRLYEPQSSVGLPPNESLFLHGSRIGTAVGKKVVMNGVRLPAQKMKSYFQQVALAKNSRYRLGLYRITPQGNTVNVDFLRKDTRDKVLFIYYPIDIATSYRTLFSEHQLQNLSHLDMALRNFLLKIKKSKLYNKIFIRFGGGDIRRKSNGSLLTEFTGIQSVSAHLFMDPDMMRNIGDTYLWSDSYIQDDNRFVVSNTSSSYDVIYFCNFSTNSRLKRFTSRLKDMKLYLVNIVSRDFEYNDFSRKIHLKKQLVKNLNNAESMKKLLDSNTILDFFN